MGFSPVYSDETEWTLYEAISQRLGRPYRSRGVDDRGYDCSGLVWRVFHDAGIEFERSSTRRLWEDLPEATRRERSQFGTLVFFKGLNHVGIVRDGVSFYHASTSRGVVRSYFSEYWGDRIIGFRRAFAPAPVRRKSGRERARH
jgi:cell wall-associated NlpC family hydrolase